MNDIVGKPFTSQELWHGLLKFLTPIDIHNESAYANEKDDEKLRRKLIGHFIRNNKNKFEEIQEAIDTKDYTSAHRLAHTLKSNAGQLNKTLLQQAAEVIEEGLKSGKNNVTKDQLNILKLELNEALSALEPLVEEETLHDTTEEVISTPKIHQLFNELGLLLEDSNPESLTYVDELMQIPGCEELVRQMEDFEFLQANETLIALKKEIADD